MNSMKITKMLTLLVGMNSNITAIIQRNLFQKLCLSIIKAIKDDFFGTYTKYLIYLVLDRGHIHGTFFFMFLFYIDK